MLHRRRDRRPRSPEPCVPASSTWPRRRSSASCRRTCSTRSAGARATRWSGAAPAAPATRGTPPPASTAPIPRGWCSSCAARPATIRRRSSRASSCPPPCLRPRARRGAGPRAVGDRRCHRRPPRARSPPRVRPLGRRRQPQRALLGAPRLGALPQPQSPFGGSAPSRSCSATPARSCGCGETGRSCRSTAAPGKQARQDVVAVCAGRFASEQTPFDPSVLDALRLQLLGGD